MPHDLAITLLGELRVVSGDTAMVLPASKKARALLAFLVATGRPHRRERLCELLWDMPDDPKAGLRWSLSKLRKVVDSPDRTRILADRERVCFDVDGVSIDTRDIYARLGSEAPLPMAELERMARLLENAPLEGLDGAGDQAFAAWLASEREDAQIARVEVLRRLATHPDMDPLSAQKWLRKWRELDPAGAPPEAVGVSMDAERRSPRTATPEGSALRAQQIGFCEARDGAKIAYATVGAGPPMLKAANWLNHLEFDWTSPIWGGSFAEIARHRTFIRYDERGCGLSDWDVDDLSFDAFVQDLEAVVDKVGLERFPLLGISQGCAVSIEYAVRHPERVSGLILIGGYAAGWRILATPEERARRETVMKLTELGWGTDDPAYRHIFSHTFMPDATPEDLTWFDDFQRRTTSPRNAARFQDAFGHIDVRHRLSQVRAPTLVLHSKNDQRIPLDQGRAIASAIPDARFIPLDSRNHVLVNHEPAWSVCFRAIEDFLRETGI